MPAPIVTQAPVADLGECPRYDAATGTLSWVDIDAGRLWCADVLPEAPLAETLQRARLLIEVPGPLGCAVRRGLGAGSQSSWLLGHGGAVVEWTEGSRPRTVVQVEPDEALVRLNDGAVGPDGRLWVGSIPVPRPLQPWGRLHRVGMEAEAETLMDGLLAANGIGWSPDASVLYLVDTGRKLIHRLGAGEPLSTADIPGSPDGIAVDIAGCVWVAMWGGAAVVRLSPDGELIDRISMPCSRPTACALVDRRLLVTTARVESEPQSGHVFAIDVDTPGLPAPRALQAPQKAGIRWKTWTAKAS